MARRHPFPGPFVRGRGHPHPDCAGCGKGYRAGLPTLVALIFVLLGLEILGYLFLSKHGQPVIRYDLFSLFLVGIIGFAGTILLLFASTGLLEEIRQAVTLVEVSRDVTPLQKDIPAGVSRIVLLNPEHNAIRLEKGKTNELHLFGTCTTQTLPEEATAPVRAEEIVSVRTVGDTMYVTIEGLRKNRELSIALPFCA